MGLVKVVRSTTPEAHMIKATGPTHRELRVLSAVRLKTVCAWCSVLIHDGALPLSHGICAECREREFGAVKVLFVHEVPEEPPVVRAVPGRHWQLKRCPHLSPPSAPLSAPVIQGRPSCVFFLTLSLL